MTTVFNFKRGTEVKYYYSKFFNVVKTGKVSYDNKNGLVWIQGKDKDECISKRDIISFKKG